MDQQSYLAAVERLFEKSEYITIKKLPVKLLTAPRVDARVPGRLFCFIVRDAAPDMALCTALARYALSLSFYDDAERRRKDAVLVLFPVSSLDEGAKALLSQRCKKIGSAACLPAVFDLSQNTLHCARKFPPFGGGEFQSLCTFAHKFLQPEKEE